MKVEGSSSAPLTSSGMCRRDYILLPLLSLATVVLMLGASEWITRSLWPEQTDDPCFVQNDVLGFRYKPNCVSRTKNAEGSWVTNKFNECGYRSETSCKQKPSISLRMTVIGSSVSMGLFVPYRETFFAITGRQLSADCGRSVDVQNLGVPEESILDVYARLDEVIALRPDLVVYPLTPFDVEQGVNLTALAEQVEAPFVHTVPHRTYKRTTFAELQRTVRNSRSALIAQHLLFADDNRFVQLYMMYGDKAAFLRKPMSPAWSERFAGTNMVLTAMAARLRRENIPFMVVAVPSRAEAALLHVKRQMPDTDPYAFGRLISAMAEEQAALALDLVQTFAAEPSVQGLFYVVDGHLTAAGQKVVAGALTTTIESKVPAFTTVTKTGMSS
jgi:hypothetical protein